MNIRLPLDKKRQDDSFCLVCLTHERYFEGGYGSLPPLCPCGAEKTINWQDMDSKQRLLAQQVYDRRDQVIHETS